MTGQDFDHVFDAPQKPVLREFKELAQNEGDDFDAIHRATLETFRIVMERRRRISPRVDNSDVLLDMLSMTVHASRKLEKRLSEAEATLDRIAAEAKAAMPARLKSVA